MSLFAVPSYPLLLFLPFLAIKLSAIGHYIQFLHMNFFPHMRMLCMFKCMPNNIPQTSASETKKQKLLLQRSSFQLEMALSMVTPQKQLVWLFTFLNNTFRMDPCLD